MDVEFNMKTKVKNNELNPKTKIKNDELNVKTKLDLKIIALQ